MTAIMAHGAPGLTDSIVDDDLVGQSSWARSTEVIEDSEDNAWSFFNSILEQLMQAIDYHKVALIADQERMDSYL